MRTPEPEALHDDRRSPVGGDHEAGREALAAGGAGPDGLGDDARDPVPLAEQVDHADPLADPDPDLARSLDERRVEQPPAHREGVGRVALRMTRRGVIADQERPVGREDAHAA